ncbi:MAG TPA: glutamyl-tRNA reductase, partial [Acidimicrobiales bacterium]|nr:glutamyl-tRNA reductase [Acidimicrobiales bacterium]
LAGLGATTPEALTDNLTILFDDSVDLHLFEVAAGLRSAVPGETEVLGQVRRALEQAEAEKSAGPVLSGLFRQAVKAGRRVRSSTSISKGTTSMSHVAVDLTVQRLGDSLSDRRVLVVGAGEIAEGVVDALCSRADPPPKVSVANRTLSRAKTLAARAGGDASDMSDLGTAVEAADAVIVSTSATDPVLDLEVMERALTSRRSREPLVLVDMGVPRNVDPKLHSLPGLVLFDMYDLRAHAELAMRGRQAEVAAAEEIVRTEVDRYRAEQRARGAVPIVSALRGRIEDLRDSELQRHRSRLDRLDDESRAEVDAITRDVLAKVLHEPTVVLKETAGTPRGERLVEALRALFDL